MGEWGIIVTVLLVVTVAAGVLYAAVADPSAGQRRGGG